MKQNMFTNYYVFLIIRNMSSNTHDIMCGVSKTKFKLKKVVCFCIVCIFKT